MLKKNLLPVLIVLLLSVIAVATAVLSYKPVKPISAQNIAQLTPRAYLPLVTKPIPRLANPSFEDGWTTVEFGNQIPNGWTVTWLQLGEKLYDGSSTVTGICECVHKLDWQLPADQQPGGSDALILDGVVVYKIFSPQIFGVEMRQTVTGLAAGENWRLTVPIRVHLNGETDPWGAQTYVEVNGVGQWANGSEMGDQQWYEHVLDFTIPANGAIEVIVRFQNKWLGNKDFFIDDIVLEQLP